MYKIAGITQMCITEKNSGEIVGCFSKFASKSNMHNIAGLSNTLYQLSKMQEREMEFNIFEFGTGEKLFTVSGGENVLVSALSDKSVQIGITRMYLKRFSESLDKNFLKLSLEDGDRSNELAEIFQLIGQGK